MFTICYYDARNGGHIGVHGIYDSQQELEKAVIKIMFQDYFEDELIGGQLKWHDFMQKVYKFTDFDWVYDDGDWRIYRIQNFSPIDGHVNGPHAVCPNGKMHEKAYQSDLKWVEFINADESRLELVQDAFENGLDYDSVKEHLGYVE